MRLAQFVSSLAAVAMIAAPATRAAAQTQQIHFDGTGAPCRFDQTSPLTTAYAAQGVTFGGGGAILNQCGNFGFDARSGTDFLAFNVQSYATGPEVLQFTAPIGAFSIFAASAFPGTVFTADAFDASGTLVSTAESTPTGSAYTELSLQGAGISRVQLTSNAQYYAYDDLEFTASTVTPEPASWALVGAGLLVTGAAVRRRAS